MTVDADEEGDEPSDELRLMPGASSAVPASMLPLRPRWVPSVDAEEEEAEENDVGEKVALSGLYGRMPLRADPTRSSSEDERCGDSSKEAKKEDVRIASSDARRGYAALDEVVDGEVAKSLSVNGLLFSKIGDISSVTSLSSIAATCCCEPIISNVPAIDHGSTTLCLTSSDGLSGSVGESGRELWRWTCDFGADGA